MVSGACIMMHMTNHTYTAEIMNAEGTELVTTDLRTIDTDRLIALRDEAGMAGDSDMVATIDAVLAAR